MPCMTIAPSTTLKSGRHHPPPMLSPMPATLPALSHPSERTSKTQELSPMLSKLTLRTPSVALVLSLAALSTGCGHVRTQIALPAASRAEPVAVPTVPASEGDCAGIPCLTDEQNAGLLGAYDDALREANRRLAWLKAWIMAAGK